MNEGTCATCRLSVPGRNGINYPDPENDECKDCGIVFSGSSPVRNSGWKGEVKIAVKVKRPSLPTPQDKGNSEVPEASKVDSFKGGLPR